MLALSLVGPIASCCLIGWANSFSPYPVGLIQVGSGGGGEIRAHRGSPWDRLLSLLPTPSRALGNCCCPDVGGFLPK